MCRGKQPWSASMTPVPPLVWSVHVGGARCRCPVRVLLLSALCPPTLAAYSHAVLSLLVRVFL
eukprot:1215363-Pleurochrysis_carterae.AAC.1